MTGNQTWHFTEIHAKESENCALTLPFIRFSPISICFYRECNEHNPSLQIMNT